MMSIKRWDLSTGSAAAENRTGDFLEKSFQGPDTDTVCNRSLALCCLEQIIKGMSTHIADGQNQNKNKILLACWAARK